MIVFWSCAALLSLLVSLCVAIPALRGRDRAEGDRRDANVTVYRQRREELEFSLAQGAISEADMEAARLQLDRALLADAAAVESTTPASSRSQRKTVIAVVIAIPLLSLALYAFLGASGGMQLETMLRKLDTNMPDEQRAQLLAQALPLLEREANGRDRSGGYRYLLARTYMTMQRYADAATVFSELAEMFPEDAGMLAQSAQARYMAADNTMTPAVEALVQRAFAIDPNQVSLLGMVGMDRFQKGDYHGAVDNWQRLLDQLPADAPDAEIIRNGIAMARKRLGEPEAPASTATVAISSASLQVAVSVKPGLEIAPGSTVFVFAKAVSGPPMPLAVARFPATELPKTVELNDSMAMAPGLKLSSFPKVSVTARISRSGSAIGQPGDLEGGGQQVELSTSNAAVEVTVDRTL